MPDHRPDKPCETQEPPNLAAPGGGAPEQRPVSGVPGVPLPIEPSVLLDLIAVLDNGPQDKRGKSEMVKALEAAVQRRGKSLGATDQRSGSAPQTATDRFQGSRGESR